MNITTTPVELTPQLPTSTLIHKAIAAFLLYIRSTITANSATALLALIAGHPNTQASSHRPHTKTPNWTLKLGGRNAKREIKRPYAIPLRFRYVQSHPAQFVVALHAPIKNSSLPGSFNRLWPVINFLFNRSSRNDLVAKQLKSRPWFKANARG